jgi:hypothetical protein
MSTVRLSAAGNSAIRAFGEVVSSWDAVAIQGGAMLSR